MMDTHKKQRCCCCCCLGGKTHKKQPLLESIQDGDTDEFQQFFDCSQLDDYDAKMEADLQEMLSQLSEEELEIAARTCYAYAQNHNHNPSQQQAHAKAMAKRYLTSKKTVDRALVGMKATLQFRKEQEIDALRTAFDDTNSTLPLESRQTLEHMLSSQKNLVMGYDKAGRSTFHFIPRRTQQHDLEWTIKESLYTMERAIACSQHPDAQVNAVIDFAGFDIFQHSPPLVVGQQFLTTLRSHYVGHFYKIYIVEAPLGFAILWKIFEPFVGTRTRQKIVVVSGRAETTAVLGEHYVVEEAAPWMMEGGKKTKELDLHEYLYKTPFDHAFDETQNDRA